jgi:hypothetical protein
MGVYCPPFTWRRALPVVERAKKRVRIFVAEKIRGFISTPGSDKSKLASTTLCGAWGAMVLTGTSYVLGKFNAQRKSPGDGCTLTRCYRRRRLASGLTHSGRIHISATFEVFRRQDPSGGSSSHLLAMCERTLMGLASLAPKTLRAAD